MRRTRKSVKILTLAVPVTKSAKLMHFLSGWAAGSQFAEIGRQLNVVIRKVARAAMALRPSRNQIARRTEVFCPLRRRRKRRMEGLMS